MPENSQMYDTKKSTLQSSFFELSEQPFYTLFTYTLVAREHDFFVRGLRAHRSDFRKKTSRARTNRTSNFSIIRAATVDHCQVSLVNWTRSSSFFFGIII